MFSFEQYSRSGGKALDFYCYMVFWLATAKKITYKEGENNENFYIYKDKYTGG